MAELERIAGVSNVDVIIPAARLEEATENGRQTQ
jgi:hypothetical protein